MPETRRGKQYMHEMYDKKSHIKRMEILLKAFNIQNTLSRGYSIVVKDGHVIKNIEDILVNDNIEIKMINGKRCGIYIDDDGNEHIVSNMCPHMKCILEKGDTDLDSSIKLFEEGLKLSEKLNLQLGEYEKKIESLVSDKENENE